MRLAVCSSKGGVGKTSTAANLAVVLGTRGRTLVVDADPQDSLGRAFGVVAKGREDSLAGLLEDPSLDPRGAIRAEVAPGVDVLPAHTALEAVGVALAAQGGLISSVRRTLRPVLPDYDHVVLDTHGDLGNLTLAAVCAADAVLSVFTSDPGSALGVARISAFLHQHRAFENTSAVLLGAACSLWDGQAKAARIPLSRRVPSATLAKRPVVLTAPSSTVATAYAELTDEVLAAYAGRS
jgi:chromosome partitioning protein